VNVKSGAGSEGCPGTPDERLGVPKEPRAYCSVMVVVTDRRRGDQMDGRCHVPAAGRQSFKARLAGPPERTNGSAE
jgi:hypothetical protein